MELHFEIDEELPRAAGSGNEGQTEKATIEAALRMLIEFHERAQARELRDKVQSEP
jgi:hypothetical protein